MDETVGLPPRNPQITAAIERSGRCWWLALTKRFFGRVHLLVPRTEDGVSFKAEPEDFLGAHSIVYDVLYSNPPHAFLSVP